MQGPHHSPSDKKKSAAADPLSGESFVPRPPATSQDQAANVQSSDAENEKPKAGNTPTVPSSAYKRALKLSIPEAEELSGVELGRIMLRGASFRKEFVEELAGESVELKDQVVTPVESVRDLTAPKPGERGSAEELGSSSNEVTGNLPDIAALMDNFSLSVPEGTSRVEFKNSLLDLGCRTIGDEAAPLLNRVLGEQIVKGHHSLVDIGVRKALVKAAQFGVAFSQLDMPLTDERRSKPQIIYDVFKTIVGDSEPLEFVCTTCPDYPYDERERRYSRVGELGSGVGLSGRTLVTGVLPLLKKLTEHDIPNRIVLAFANIEADDQDMLTRVGLNRDEFDRRVGSSMEKTFAFASRVCNEYALNTSVEVCGISDYMQRGSVELNSELEQKTRNIMLRRTSHYDHFFDVSMFQETREEFRLQRARRDVVEHLDLGRTLGARRQEGKLVSIVTSSLRSLSRLFNYDKKGQTFVPVLRVPATDRDAKAHLPELLSEEDL